MVSLYFVVEKRPVQVQALQQRLPSQPVSVGQRPEASIPQLELGPPLRHRPRQKIGERNPLAPPPLTSWSPLEPPPVPLAGGSGQGSKGMGLGVKSQVTSTILLISVSPGPTPGQGSDRRKSTKYREKQNYYQNVRHQVWIVLWDRREDITDSTLRTQERVTKDMWKEKVKK